MSRVELKSKHYDPFDCSIEVTDVDNPARQPAQFTQTYSASGGVFRTPLWDVIPAGKTLVLEFVSVNQLTFDPSSTMRVILEVSDFPGVCPQDPTMRHVLPKPELITVSDSGVLNHVVSQFIRMYALEGQQLCLHLNRSGDTSSQGIDVHLAGYFVDSEAP